MWIVDFNMSSWLANVWQEIFVRDRYFDVYGSIYGDEISLAGFLWVRSRRWGILPSLGVRAICLFIILSFIIYHSFVLSLLSFPFLASYFNRTQNRDNKNHEISVKPSAMSFDAEVWHRSGTGWRHVEDVCGRRTLGGTYENTRWHVGEHSVARRRTLGGP